MVSVPSATELAAIVVDRVTFPVPSKVIPVAVTFPVRENVRAVAS